MEAVRALAAVGADDHAHRERGAILAGPQRAQIVGDALRQHRHDAVGEIDRVAAHERLAVERGARPHVMGDVGDRDADDEAAGIFRDRGRGVGVHGVVVILGVGRIDGDERHARASPRGRPASAGAARPPPPPAPRGGNTCGMSWAWMAIRLTARSLLSEPSRSFTRAGRQAEAALACAPPRRRPGRRPAASAVAPGGIASSRPSCFLSTGDEPPAAAGQRAEDAEHALLGAVDDLDDAPACGGSASSSSPVSSTRSSARSPTPATSPGRARRGTSTRIFGGGAVRLLVPFGRNRDQLAVAVARGDVGEHDRGAGVPARCSFLRRRSTWPSSASSRSMRLSATRSAFFRPKARAISRVPTLPGCVADEGEEVLLGGEGRFGDWSFHENIVREQSSLARLYRWRRQVSPARRHLPAALALRAGFFAALTRLAWAGAAAFGFAGALRGRAARLGAAASCRRRRARPARRAARPPARA